MKNPEQRMRFTDVELGVIKGLFADNVELLYIIRKSLLQATLTPEESDTLRQVINESTYALFVKIFMPYVDVEAPLFQLTDSCLVLGAEIKDLSPEGAWPYIRAKDLEIDYIAQQLRILNGGSEKPKIVLSELINLKVPKSKAEDALVGVLARNFILSYVDSNIKQIQFLAGQKEETVEETKAKLLKDSAE